MTNLVLPDKLKAIRTAAFSGCSNLTGSLLIPEGVTEIDKDAFYGCRSFNGTLSLPTTLKRIGDIIGYNGYWDGPFRGCQFVCELVLPDNLEIIGCGAFGDCPGLHGSIKLPSKLKYLGEGAFQSDPNLTGDIIIPQGVTYIPENCFDGSGFDGNLTLHDGITSIGSSDFAH